MAEAIGLAILGALEVSATPLVASLVGSVTITAVAAGAQYALAALTAEKPRNEAQQATLSQALGPRVGIYGRAMVGGTRYFWDARNGTLYQGIVLAGHRIDGIERYWIGDKPVTTNQGENGGTVNDFPYLNRVGFEPHLGLDDQPASPLLLKDYPGIWTPQHQLRGLAHVVAAFNPVKKEDQQIVYPQGYATVLRFVVRGARVWNSRDAGMDPQNPAAWTFSENAGDCILDYLRRRDGARFPLSKIDVPSFADFGALCAEGVPRKNGTTEPRYRIGGTYLFNEAPKDVLARMCATCDGQIVQGPSGKYGIRGGRFRSPLVNIPTKNILTADVEQGVDRIDGYNRLTVAYTEPENFYQATQVEAYQDAASQARIGVVDQSADLIMVPSFTQAARLAKIRFKKDNPTWKGSLGCQLPALDALGSDNVHVTFDPVPEIGSMFDESFMVTALNIEGDASAVGLGISSLSASTYAWDPALEEPTKPATPQTIERVNAIASPTGVSVVADRRVVAGGSTAVWGVLSWAASPRPDVTVEPSYRLLSATEANFRPMSTRQNELSAEAGPLTDTEGYVFRVRFRSGGQVSDWSEAVTLTATADGTAPTAPTYTSAALTGTSARHTFRQSPSLNARTIELLRADGFGKTSADATVVFSEALSPNQSDAYDDVFEFGYRQTWMRAKNGSGVVSPVDGPKVMTKFDQAGNLTIAPNDLSHTSWTKSNLSAPSPVSGGPTGPDGALATMVSETAASGSKSIIWHATGLTSGKKFRAIYGIKPSGRTRGRLDLFDPANPTTSYTRVVFNLGTGVLGTVATAGSAFTGTTANLVKVSADYWLLVLTSTATLTAIDTRFYFYDDAGVASYTGDTSKGMYLWACTFAMVT